MSEALITESEPLTFTLPDGSLKLVRKGTTLQNVAESIDSSVAKNAVYAEIDGQYIDLIEAVQKSGTLNIITLFDEEALDPCTLEQLEGECKSILHLVLDIYKQFGFEEVEIKLSTRPEKRMGSDTDWDRLENALSASLEAQGLQWSVDRGYIREGYWADLVVIDPFSHQQIIREDVAYKCGWSPFEGRILSGGAVDMTLVNGHVIWNGHTIQQKYGLPLEFCR